MGASDPGPYERGLRRLDLSRVGHSLWVRLNAIVSFALTTLLCLALATWATALLESHPPNRSGVQVRTLKSLRSHGGVDRALLSLDLDADLGPTFDWNVHTLFLFVVAEYETKKNPLNQVIIWDKIVKSSEGTLLDDKDLTVKYALIDQLNGLRNTSVSLRLAWDVVPLTGMLKIDTNATASFDMPGQYFDTGTAASGSKSKRSKRRG